MSLRYILLGLLQKPASGYSLKQEFNNTLRHFWHAELAQVYPALHKLEKEGFLTSKTVPSEKGPPQRLYQRTELGKQALLNWLEDKPQSAPSRVGFLAQVFFLYSHQNPEKALVFFEELKHLFQSQRARLQNIEIEWKEEDPCYPDQLTDEDFYPQLTLRLGLLRADTTIAWCDECIMRIQKRIKRKNTDS